LARAEQQVEEVGDDCPVRGYLMIPKLASHLQSGNHEAAASVANAAAQFGRRLGETDLVALACSLGGRARLRQARVGEGLALLDEAMVAATGGELSPMVTGLVYCQVIATCQQICAIDRAREWTAALSRWCAPISEIVFVSNCRVHRSEIMQIGGEWSQALEEVEAICSRSPDEEPGAFASACYQRGELLRLQGHFEAAEMAYQQANQAGREPQPGLALLRLTQKRTTAAASVIRRVLATTPDGWKRMQYLPACVEIMIANEDVDEARRAADELETLARRFEIEILSAIAAHARGAVLLAEGDSEGAVAPLHQAIKAWQCVGAPYIIARIRTLVARAYAELGDDEGAALERNAAYREFQRLGATPDVMALESERRPAPSFGMSSRELEVLRGLASGKTNKEIARNLCVSERTIHRHVSNIFSKIGVSSRAAATAFAYQNDLLETPG
jgi:DNA-binding NarL/FixJ family response regulator